MSAATFTPGPWRLRTNKHRTTDGRDWGWVSHNTDANICVPGLSLEWSGEQGRANARLIAAAPDLIEALAAMQEAWLDYHDAHSLTEPVTGKAGNAFDKAAAAISKARGEP